jgi:hypothetical protein
MFWKAWVLVLASASARALEKPHRKVLALASAKLRQTVLGLALAWV